MQFSHLHNHTQFSLLDGASSIPKLYQKAIKDNMPAIAITDHGNMFGVFEFVAQAWKNTMVVGKTADGKDIIEPQVKPIVGCEFYLVENRFVKQFTKTEKDKRYHQLLLAKDEKGYQNLVKLCSLGYIDGLYSKYPRIDKELILQYHEGLIATTCCLGAEVPRTILEKGEEEAEKLFKWWLDLFGDDYYVEFQRHDIPDQNKVNQVLIKFAHKYNVPIIASNDSHYIDEEDANAHDILLCVNTGEKQSTEKMKDFGDDDGGTRNKRFAFYNNQFYFKTTAEMQSLFHDLPEAIENTQLIVDKVKALKLERDILLPHFKVPTNFNDNQDAYLEHLTWEGAYKRYKEITAEVEERLKFELSTIKMMGFAGYFLIVADFIKAGRDMGVFIGPGRGSAAGSAVAYCIGITNIDPIKYNLLFERFLNPDRKSMPDIDTDFEDAGRQKVIDYVVQKYGRNQVAQIITYGTMAAKSSIKDVARVLDLPLSTSVELTKLVPDKPGISLKRVLHAPIDKSTETEKSLTDKEELKEEDLSKIKTLREIYADEGKLESTVLKEAEKLEGSIRNTGIHAAGIIIAPSDLSNLIPVSTSKDVNLLITQFEGNVIESAGVIKMDFLGLRNLSILKDAIALIKANYDIHIDLDQIPLDDKKTFELYQRGETNGTFQFESPGMQKHLKDLKPDQFGDLIAMNALYRPGPIQYIPDFIKRKQGEQEISYELPEMEEYLADTYGITVYQEQVMLLSQKLAGFSKGDADVLRKAMGKKDRKTLDKMKGKFMAGAMAKGHAENILQKIWTDWESFAQYAFNKSHSTCYALVAYQTAYLKANYPSEYMAAVLNNANNIEKITFFMNECKRMGLQVLGPDVNESQMGFAVNKDGVIRFGLSAIKGVGEAAVEDLLKERSANGPFKDVFELIKRLNLRTVNKKSIESLILGGAFDTFKEMHRAQYFYSAQGDKISNLDKIISFGNKVQSDQIQGSASLFGAMEMPEIQKPVLENCPEWELPELLKNEKAVIGIYLSAHPLDGYKFEIENLQFTNLQDIESSLNKPIRVAGFVTNVKELVTQKGNPYMRFTINDYSGMYDITLWSNDYGKFNHFINENQRIMIMGVYQQKNYRNDQMEFQINNIRLLEDAKNILLKKISIMIPLHKLDERFYNFMLRNTKMNPGNSELSIVVNDHTTNHRIALHNTRAKITLNDDLIDFLKQNSELEYFLEVNPN